MVKKPLRKNSLKSNTNKARKASKSLEYVPKFDEIAQEFLSTNLFSGTIHLCALFQCTKKTFDSWMHDYESFSRAVEVGLNIGEAKSRNLLFLYALQPAKEINGNLLKLLANNVYGVKEELSNEVVIHTPDREIDIEKEMAKRGIPVPVIEMGDL